MTENSRVCTDQLTGCMQVMCNAGRMRADKFDKAIAEYENFLERKKPFQSMMEDDWIIFLFFASFYC